MRILRVAQKLYPDVTGGAPYHVHALSRDQAATGHDVTVLTVRHDPALAHVEARAGYTVVRFDPIARPLGNDVSPGLAQFLATANGFDVIHAHSHIYLATNLAALKRTCGDVPLAITNHGLYSQTAPAWAFEGYLRSVGRWTFDRADVVCCYTDAERRRLRELGVTTAVEVIPNGIDTERFTPKGPESDLLESDGPAVVFVGRLVEGKRPVDALAAVESIREEVPGVTLYVCGEGPLREELERRAGGELGTGVVFLGHVPYDEMPGVYRAADALVLPSRAEGVPRTVLEAQSTGTPVVVSELDSVDEVLGSDGRQIPVGDVSALAEALEAVLTASTDGDLEGAHGPSVTDWSHTMDATTETLASISRRR